MGTLRVFLALSVAYGHAGLFLGFPLIPGDTAVQVFYAISGFYMALVLNERYRADNSSYLLFLANRAARLFPAYTVVLVATLLLALIASNFRSIELPFVAYWRSIDHLGVWEAVFLLGSQLAMIGQDLYLFLTLRSGSLSFIADFHADPRPLANLLIIPPGWTLGVEFTFYLLAPFVVRRQALAMVLIVFASLALRLVLQFQFNLYGDPWSYRFFPSELALFMVGAVGYRVYRSIEDGTGRCLAPLYSIACICIAGTLLINRWNGLTRFASVGLLLVLLLAIPTLFRATKSNSLDRNLGELSYPIYICHFTAIWAVAIVDPSAGVARGIIIMTCTILLAVLLYCGVDGPVDGWRHRRLSPRRAA